MGQLSILQETAWLNQKPSAAHPHGIFDKFQRTTNNEYMAKYPNQKKFSCHNPVILNCNTDMIWGCNTWQWIKKKKKPPFTITDSKAAQKILLQFAYRQASQMNELNSPDNFPIRGLVLQIYVSE